MLYFWKKQTRQLLKQFFVTFFHFRILQIFNNKCIVKNLKYYIYLPNEKCKKNYLFVNILSVHPGFLKCDYTLHACWWYYPASYLFVFRPKILTFLQLAGWSHVTSKKSAPYVLTPFLYMGDPLTTRKGKLDGLFFLVALRIPKTV